MLTYVFTSLLDPLVLLSLFLAFAGALSWIAAVSRLPLSAAYPFQSLTLVFTVMGTVLLFGESVSTTRWMGIAAVTVGLLLVGRG
jgi:drug/metabolite transporter (DMT)-like permease